MHLMRRIFGGGGDPKEQHLAKGNRRGDGCIRFEKSILLSISGDLAGRASRSLSKHLAGCAGCRESLARSARLRQQCLEVASGRQYAPSSIWAGVAAGIEEAPALTPSLTPLGWRGAASRRVLTAWGLSLAAAAVVLCILTPVLLDRLRGPEPANRTALDTRWSREWDEFVSGSEPRGDINIDPFAPEIPNPEVIDF